METSSGDTASLQLWLLKFLFILSKFKLQFIFLLLILMTMDTSFNYDAYNPLTYLMVCDTVVMFKKNTSSS